MYVIDQGNDRIQKISNEGKFITKWGHGGETEGNFISPSGITIEPSGDVYVTDQSTRQNIQVFSTQNSTTAIDEKKSISEFSSAVHFVIITGIFGTILIHKKFF